MNPEAIAALQDALPNAFQPSGPGSTWPEGILNVPPDNDFWEEIEDELYLPGTPDDPDPLGDTPDGSLPPDVVIDVGGALSEGDSGGYDTAHEIADALRDRMGGDWPGAPGGYDQYPGQSTGSRHGARPATEVLAFYLPWHRFSASVWGIYLLVEGVTALGQDIRARYPHILSRSDSHRAAKLFLYHHEAYHNAVETFAARIEVSHRQPCYLSGVQVCARSLLANSFLHEEGLANAYAHAKVRQTLFLQEKSISATRRRVKRVAAASALGSIFALQPPAYASAGRVLNGTVSFELAEHELQEACHGLSGMGVRPAAPGIWLGAPRAMAPSLARNKSFSYVISRRHPLVRHAANVPQYSRTEVVRRLHLATGGREAGGGEHPKLVMPNGKRIPVPGHRDLKRGTIRGILQQAGLPLRLNDFMAASDAELKRAALEV